MINILTFIITTQKKSIFFFVISIYDHQTHKIMNCKNIKNVLLINILQTYILIL